MVAHAYSPVLVAISVVIACLASYTALDLAGRVTVARARNRLTWLLYGSTAMGTGIWSMHFVGMLAFRMSIPVSYNVPLILTSALIAVGAALLAMFTVSRAELPMHRLIAAGAIMGIAIAGMHYTGMAAMRMPAALDYDPLFLWGSIAIAVSASCVALWLAYRFRNDETLLGRWRRALGALVMGLAISGMHYTGMHAAHFTPAALYLDTASYTIPTGSWLTIGVIIGPVLVLVLALVGASVDRHKGRTVAEYARLRQLRDEMELTVAQRTAELRAALQSAEQANRAKSEFLAQMSHELRTPLNSVIGFADILSKNQARNLQPRDLLYIERISANGRHLLTLINNVLDLAKVEAGHVELDISTFSLATLIEDVVNQMGGARASSKVPLLADIPLNLAQVSTDAAKLRQMLLNLVGNANKFTDAGSITIRVVADETRVPRRIDVIDTGIGIPAERIEAIFRPFEQADGSTARKYGGTGLGLAITLTMCELLGATLTVDSVLGQGSTFSIVLPAQIASELPAEAPASELDWRDVQSLDTLDRDCSRDALVEVLRRHSRSTPTRVLIVEDEPDAQAMLLHHLHSEKNVETRASDSGITALQQLATFVPDLILLNVRMPKMDGVSFLKHLRREPLYEHIPVVVVTGAELTTVERSELRSRSLGIVAKGEGLESAVHRALVHVESALDAEPPAKGCRAGLSRSARDDQLSHARRRTGSVREEQHRLDNLELHQQQRAVSHDPIHARVQNLLDRGVRGFGGRAQHRSRILDQRRIRLAPLDRSAEIVLHAKVTICRTLHHCVAEVSAQEDQRPLAVLNFRKERLYHHPARRCRQQRLEARLVCAAVIGGDAPRLVRGGGNGGLHDCPARPSLLRDQRIEVRYVASVAGAHPDRRDDRYATRIEVSEIALVHAPLHERGSISERSVVLCPPPHSPRAEIPAGDDGSSSTSAARCDDSSTSPRSHPTVVASTSAPRATSASRSSRSSVVMAGTPE